MDQPQPQNVQTAVQPVLATPIPQVQQEFCSKCKNKIVQTDNFCPHCGTKVVRSVSIGKQIWIYLVSILLPPLGLGYTFKYFRSQHKQVMWVGIIAGVLTIVSAVVTTWWTIGIFQNVNQQVQQEFKGYQNLGY